MEKNAEKRKLTIVILLSKNFLLQLDSTLKSVKSRSYSQVSVLLFSVKCEWSLLASKKSYYRLHLLFYQLPLRQITLSSHSHDQSRLWAALSSGRTRSFSLTWRLPQESHQTSQVMLHWSEKCKTYKRLRLGVNAFLGHFCCQVWS